MQRNCKNCNKPYAAKNARSSFCSSTCRSAFRRNNDTNANAKTESLQRKSSEFATENPATQTQNESTPVIQPERKFTHTDRLFQNDAIKRNLGPDWLSFSPIVREINCRICGVKVKTRLALLRYCSPDCQVKDTV